MNYYEVPILARYFLEDSYVLSVKESESSLVFDLEAVLCEQHPEYRAPLENELYCFKKVKLCFSSFDYLKWEKKEFREFRDASGSVDYGNIDKLLLEVDRVIMVGEWGRVVLFGGEISVLIV